MTRRIAVGACFAVIAQMFKDSAEARQLKLTLPRQHERLVVFLGDSGYKAYEFRHGAESVTLTADELFAALKGEAPR